MHGKFLTIRVIKTNLPPEELERLPEVTNIILGHISSGNTTWDEIHGFLDWFFSLSKINRQAVLNDFEAGKLLCCISQEKNLLLSPVKGSEQICNAYRLFSHVDDDFRVYNIEQGNPTPLTPVAVYEIVRSASVIEALRTLSQEFDPLCLTQHQILNFVSRFKPWLSKDYPTYFLLKSHGGHYVVSVESMAESDLHALIHTMESIVVKSITLKARIVVPRM